MGYLLRMAGRNVGRNRRRSILAVSSVTISIMGVVLLQGMTGGFLDSMVKNYTKNESGHVRVTTKTFHDRIRFMPVNENMENPKAVFDAIASDPALSSEVRVATERVTFGVLLDHEGKNKPALAMAGDPKVEKDLLMLEQAVMPGGRYIENEREAIIGRKLAEALDFQVGDTLKVAASGADDALHLRKFTIVGLFDSGLNMLDERVFQIGLSDAKKLLRMGDTAQQIIIMARDPGQADQLAARVKTLLNNPGLHVASWTENSDVYKMVTLASTIYNFFYLCVALLGSFIIGNILMMVVMERRREIGVLRAMGFQRGEILRLFIAEGMVLGFAGSLLGVVLGLAVNLFFHFHGMDFSSMMGVGNIPIDNVIYPKISLANTLMALAIGTLVSALVSIIPSQRAARLQVADAIRVME